MDISEHTPLIVGDGGVPTDHHHHHHHHHHHSTTTTTTTPHDATTTPPQNAEDTVDGILFNTGPLHPCPTPAPADERVPRPPLPHLKGGEGGTGGQPIKVYQRRFWILGAFSFVAMFQCLMWNTWGPLSASMGAAYPGWGSGTVAMMGDWGNITFVAFVAPMCWLMHAKGLRVGVLACGGLMAAGTVVRVVPLMVSTNTTFFTVMCHVCAILVGTSGTLVMAAPPMVAAVWFPPKERTTATSVGQMLNILGNAGSYLEPLLVREPTSPHPPAAEVTLIQGDIRRLMYIWAGVGVVMMVLLVVYFPAKPPSPPSLTSHVERLDFKESLKMMCRNRDLLLVTLSYGLTLGVPSAWASVLNYSLYQLGMSQSEAMWVGLSSVVAGGVMALAVGRFTDLFYGHIKLSLLVFMALTLAFFYWFFLLTWGAIPVTTWQIYLTVIGASAFNYSTCSLFFELAVECAYPCSEVVVGGLLTATNNLVGLFFLLLFLVPFSSYQWVTYVLLATVGVAFVPLVFVREDYSRSSLDRSPSHSAYQPI